jgi:hypothetical protein
MAVCLWSFRPHVQTFNPLGSEGSGLPAWIANTWPPLILPPPPPSTYTARSGGDVHTREPSGGNTLEFPSCPNSCPNTRDLRTGQKSETTGRYLLKQSGHCWTNAFKADLCGLVQRHVSAAPGVIQQPDPNSRSSLSVEMFTNPLTDANDAT